MLNASLDWTVSERACNFPKLGFVRRNARVCQQFVWGARVRALRARLRDYAIPVAPEVLPRFCTRLVDTSINSARVSPMFLNPWGRSEG